MNHNAYAREYRHVTAEQLSQETASVSADNAHFDELSSSGVESDWILFSPLTDEELDDEALTHGDVLSSSTDEVNIQTPPLKEQEGEDEDSEMEEDDDDDDDDSLIESLGTNVHLSMPLHDGSGSFATPSHTQTHSSSSQHAGEDFDHLQTLKKEDLITHRIDTWRKEQAKVMINDLHRHSLTSSSSVSTEKTCELLASWGVDDGLFLTGDADENSDEGRSSSNKRFYGDDLLKGYTEWEVNKIKRVAQQLSSSLVREQLGHSSPPVSSNIPLTSTFRARRSSLLLNISRSANKYFIQNVMIDEQPFWKKDLSSAHSSLSLSTNSIMFGNLNLGEA